MSSVKSAGAISNLRNVPRQKSSRKSSKIPLRPRKIRRVTNDGKSSKTTPSESPATPPRIVSRSLSCEGEIELAIQHLRSADPRLTDLIDTHRRPAFDSSHPPFLALSKSIIYQQLASRAATSIYTRFVSLCGGELNVLPHIVLALSPQELRQIGVSGRKSSYLHDLASKYQEGFLSDSSIVEMDDDSLFAKLTIVNGIGPWSVHMFMIFTLQRPDVLPASDLGVRKGVQLLHGLEKPPRPNQMEELCEKWRPYRSVASWYMWRLVEGKGILNVE
ncbi:DNA-3-methyladenine glycosylase II [Bertholletia excelsa]